MTEEELKAYDEATRDLVPRRDAAATLTLREATIHLPRYQCSIHGDVSDERMYIQIRVDSSFNRSYCMRCYVEALDRIGVQQLIEKK